MKNRESKKKTAQREKLSGPENNVNTTHVKRGQRTNIGRRFALGVPNVKEAKCKARIF
jgi:hypothetical protein